MAKLRIHASPSTSAAVSESQFATHTSVSVKRLLRSKLTHEALARFKEECELMLGLRHPNIVQFLGYVDTPFVIVMELLPAGDLRSYWRKHNMLRARWACFASPGGGRH